MYLLNNFQIKNQDVEYEWGAVVNFKKVQEILPGRKGKQGQTKAVTKVQVDILLHVISENDAGDTIPKPCKDDQVGCKNFIALLGGVIYIQTVLHILFVIKFIF